MGKHRFKVKVLMGAIYNYLKLKYGYLAYRRDEVEVVAAGGKVVIKNIERKESGWIMKIFQKLTRDLKNIIRFVRDFLPSCFEWGVKYKI